MPGLLTQLSALNKKLSINQKLSILFLGTVVLVSILSFVYLLRREPYQLLFSNLEAADANTVVEKLKQLNIPYELGDGGRAIEVPADKVNQARIEVATQGLPSTGRIGFEIFDQTNWGLTDFAEKVNYRRALEGELERTIVSLSEVASARVHLVMEKDSLFQEEKQPAKASVVVKLKTGASLSPSRVSGVSNLVAYAVEGLSPDHVTVVDVTGNLLSQNGNREEMDSSQLELRKKMERDLSQKIVSLLEPLVGEDKVRVTSSVLMDYSEIQQTEEIFDPNGTVVLSQQRSEELLVDGARKGGIPFKANGAQGAPPNPPAGQARSEGVTRQTESVNYEVSKTVRQTKSPQGTIKQVSVAVVVDDKVTRAKDKKGNLVEKTQRRDSEEMERFRKLVSATMGFIAERGDSLTVENISFSGLVSEPAPASEPSFLEQYRRLLQNGMRYGLILLLFLFFYLLIFRPVKKKVFSYVEFDDPQYTQLAAATNAPEMVQQLQQRMAQLGQGRQGTPLALQAGQHLDPASPRSIKEQLITLAQKDPEAVTKLIRTWLAEGA